MIELNSYKKILKSWFREIIVNIESDINYLWDIC